MIIKNREERSNAVWQFIGIAAIPVVLFFLAGFSLGNTSKMEEQNWKTLYDRQKQLADSLEKKLAMYEQFFKLGEAALAKVDDKEQELDDQLSKAPQEISPNDAIKDWEDAKNLYFRGVRRTLNELNADYTEKNPKDSILSSGLKYFQKFIEFKEYRLNRRKEIVVNGLSEDDQAAVAADDAAARQQLQAQQAQLAQDQTAFTMERLKTQLEDCNKKLELANIPVSEKDKKNAEARTAITSEVQSVESEIIENMRANVIFGGDKKKIDKLRESLRTHMANIKTTADKIKP